MTTTDFDFFSEITKDDNYQLLYPQKEVGLAIVWLYQKSLEGAFPEMTFKESDIHEALDAVNPRSESKSHRKPTEHYNRTIASLQEYFLRYDDEKQVYRFKEYANEFCKHAFNTLKSNFDPTQIERICKTLTKELKEAKTPNAIREWLTINFETFKPNLRQQIDFIERQIDHSVLELRQNISTNENSKIVQILKEIDTRFDEIRGQNKELRAAFREFDIIKEHLDERSMSIDDRQIGDSIHSAHLLLQEMKKLLSMVDSRLDRIHPKVKQLFSNLNKPLFNSQIEKFLRVLLDNSTVKIERNKKLLVLPAGLPEYNVFRQLTKFSIVERKKDLFPARARRKIRYPENEQSKQIAYRHSQNQFARQDTIDIWLNRIDADLEKESVVQFSEYFFQILQSTSNDLNLAIELAYRVIRDRKIYNWTLDISTQNDRSSQFKNLELRNLLIHRAS
ncbi:hypothetical protein GCM10011506_20240 [Marivirga lumbricoides]|uniref:DUF4158 domain-containing protein n=1 Tax=Marivirga lumbricoides TaxID=1046115 RepID=A0ABQ1M751_9BACT|nr:hypothetical protein GCM10011506_20240 [Marivirga lumbricoides]